MVRRGAVYDNDGFEVTEADVAEEPEGGWCANCKEECDAKIIDNGIGVYEYGSERAVDIRLDTVSCCCEDEVLTEAPDED